MLFFAILDHVFFSSFPLLALLQHLDLAVSALLFVLAAVHAPLALLPLVLLLAVGISPFQFTVAFLKQAACQAIRRAGCISLFHARRQLCSVARLVHLCLKEFVADQIATVVALASDPAVHAAAWFAIDASIIGVKVSHAFCAYALDDIKAVSRRELVEHAASTGIGEIEFSPPATSQAEELAVTDSEARAASITSQASLESLADIFLNWFAEDTAEDSALLPSLPSSDSVMDPSMFSDTEILPSPPSSPCAQTPTRTLNAAASVFTPKRSLAAATKARRLSPLAAAFTPGLPTPPATPTVVRTRPMAARESVAGSEVASESESKAFVIHSTPVSKRLDPHVAAFVPQVRTPLNPQAAAFTPTGALLPENEASDKSSPSASVTLNPLAKEYKFTARSKPALTLDLGAITASVLHSFRGDLSPVSEASTSGPTTPTTPSGAIPTPFSKASYDVGSSAFLEPPVALTRSASFKDLRGMCDPEQTLPSSKTCFAITDVQLPSWFLAPMDGLLPATSSTHTGMTPSASLPAYF